MKEGDIIGVNVMWRGEGLFITQKDCSVFDFSYIKVHECFAYWRIKKLKQ